MYIRKQLAQQTIGHDKLNQLRHVRYFKNLDGMKNHMKKHAQIVRPKFELVLSTLEKELKEAEKEAEKLSYFEYLDKNRIE